MEDREYIPVCAVCGELIFHDEPRYNLPTDEVIHKDCLEEWADFYLRYGSLYTCVIVM